jgi:hypothetical protein
VDLSQASFKLGVYPPVQVIRSSGTHRFKEVVMQDDIRTRLTLIDLDNGRTYSFEEAKNTTFSMEGKHVRAFRWVLGSVKSEDMAKPEFIAQHNVVELSTRNVANSSSKFGTPPSI